MKRATFIINEKNIKDLKKLAAEQNRTMSDLLDEILRAGISQQREKRKKKSKFNFVTKKLGPAKVDISNREDLYNLLDD